MGETPQWDYQNDFEHTLQGEAKMNVSNYIDKKGRVTIDNKHDTDVAMNTAEEEGRWRERIPGRTQAEYDLNSDSILKDEITRAETTGYLGQLDSAMRESNKDEAVQKFLKAWEESQRMRAAYDEIQADADRQKIQELRDQLK